MNTLNFLNLEKDNLFNIFNYLPIKDLLPIRQVHSVLKEQVDVYIKENIWDRLGKEPIKTILKELKIEQKDSLFELTNISACFFKKTAQEVVKEISSFQSLHSLKDKCLQKIMKQVESCYYWYITLPQPLTSESLRKWILDNKNLLSEIKHLQLNLEDVPFISEEMEYFTNLNKLQITGKICHLPKGISRFSNLEHLNVSECGLKTLPDELSSLKNLKVFVARKNFLKKLPVLKGIKVLDLQDNRFSSLPKINQEKITHLAVSKNRFGNVQSLEAIKEMKNLKELILRDLSFSDKDRTIFLTSILPSLPKALTMLDLSRNNWKEVPIEIFKLPELKTLVLSSCQLKDLPQKEDGFAKKIQKILLNDNQLIKWPSLLKEFPLLSILSLSNNQIEEFLTEIDSIKILSLNKNPLKKIPKTINELKSLQKLFLQDTEIVEISSSFQNLTNLLIFEISSSKKLIISVKNLPDQLEEASFQNKNFTSSHFMNKSLKELLSEETGNVADNLEIQD